MICVLTGGTGGAKFVDGLRQVMPEEEITLVVNTGDDLLWWGLYVSPDIDSITYVLSGMLSRERGWGVKGDTFLCLQAMGQLGEPTWFHTGDRDLAMHLLRSRHMAEGKTLSEATTIVSEKLGVRAHILPMSDSRVETRVDTPVGELSFEEYFVQRWYQDPVNSVRFAGASDAEPAPGVLEAIESADAILIAPSNPITSIGPILAVPGIREALMSTKAKVGAVSPIVGGAAVNGPAGILMTAQGLPSSIAGVAQAYKDFLDVLICDTRDARPAEALRKTGLRVQCAQTIMRTPEDKAALARTALALVAGSSLSGHGSTGQSVSGAAVSHTSNDSVGDASAHDDASRDLGADEAASSNESPAGESSESTSATDTSSADQASTSTNQSSIDQASTDQDPASEAHVSRPFTRFQSMDKPS